MGLHLRRGRFFNDQDRAGGQLVVVIDDVLAQSAFPAQDPIGKLLWMPNMGYGPFTVVGIVGHVRHWGLAGDDQAQVRAQFYYPFAQLPDHYARRWSELMSVAVRTNVEPLSVVDSLRQQVRGATGDQVVYEVRTMEQLAKGTLAREHFLLLLFSIFAGLALILACVGIYGVLAYLTNQRVPEIGVRMALGASPADVVWLILRDSLAMIAVGVTVGTLAAMGAGHLLQHLVEGMQPTGPSPYAITISLLVATAIAPR